MESQPQNPEVMINPENFHHAFEAVAGWNLKIISITLNYIVFLSLNIVFTTANSTVPDYMPPNGFTLIGKVPIRYMFPVNKEF